MASGAGPSLSFENGIPVFLGDPGLLDEYLDRVGTLHGTYTIEQQKRNGPLAARLYSALRGDAYRVARSSVIVRSKLLVVEGVQLLLDLLQKELRPQGTVRVGELFKQCFVPGFGGDRGVGESMQAWILRGTALRQSMIAADSTTVLSDNLEAFFPAGTFGVACGHAVPGDGLRREHL